MLSLWPSDPLHYGVRALPEQCAVGGRVGVEYIGYYAISTALRTAVTNFYENRGFLLNLFLLSSWSSVFYYYSYSSSYYVCLWGGGAVVFYLKGFSNRVFGLGFSLVGVEIGF